LVLLETITGFRQHRGGAQKYYGIEPDLCCFDRAMANGFPVSAIAGKQEFMRLGGLENTEYGRVQLFNTMHGVEASALAAAIATMRTYQSEPVIEHLHLQGARLKRGIDEVIRYHRLEPFFEVAGPPWFLEYVARDETRNLSDSLQSLFIQEMVRRGVLASNFAVSYAHRDTDIDFAIDAVSGALEIYARAIEDGVERYLVGRPSKAGRHIARSQKVHVADAAVGGTGWR
jgi:glutamate-1-semialdehyde 2,1-aminomutase